jgi:hypothetical protein
MIGRIPIMKIRRRAPTKIRTGMRCFLSWIPGGFEVMLIKILPYYSMRKKKSKFK